ncbi:hypothetical protein E4K72_06330 [Oxalobacteraceae bacterium OM1]|nr:hypothetical protein E4K72_06330 [Oxalobacteraceae bacterium OM1]
MQTPALTRRTLRATGFSVGLHAVVFALLAYAAHFDSGLAVAATGTPEMTARIMRVSMAEPVQSPAAAPQFAAASLATYRSPRPPRRSVAAPAPQPSPAAETTPPAASVTPPVPEQIFGHYTEGKLTKLPAPITDIDLNIPAINGLQYTGRADLTVLIDTDGRVLDVLIASETDSVNAFADRVAARFREARFAPGEIDGVPVKSALHAVVVSESLPTAPAK